MLVSCLYAGVFHSGMWEWCVHWCRADGGVEVSHHSRAVWWPRWVVTAGHSPTAAAQTPWDVSASCKGTVTISEVGISSFLSAAKCGGQCVCIPVSWSLPLVFSRTSIL